tara:strand:- start:799 stop:1293 length:495 start_codon:yes stop_codon:yes gene_type:complete
MKNKTPTHVITSTNSAYCGSGVIVVGTTYGGERVKVLLVEEKQPKVIVLNKDSIREIQKDFSLMQPAGAVDAAEKKQKTLFAVEAFPSDFLKKDSTPKRLFEERPAEFSSYLAYSVEHAIKQYDEDYGNPTPDHVYAVVLGDGSEMFVDVEVEVIRHLKKIQIG